SHGYIGEDGEKAADEIFPYYVDVMGRIGRERGWPPASRARFEHEAGPDGALVVGSPETVAQKIVYAAKGLGASRFDVKMSNGTLPHADLM
ncbi:LLM class flavin-dependent oxidoreductase, partial [Bacillus sp. SIMBA_069]